MKPLLYVIKVGGNVIDDEVVLKDVLQKFSEIPYPKIFIHGGGKLATKLATQLNIKQQIVEGRRITDAETLKIVTMVYAGWINKKIVAQLNSLQKCFIGMCGADAQLILSQKREIGTTDFGFVGDILNINKELLKHFLEQNLFPIIAPITMDDKGQLLNTNADTVAQHIATTMSKNYEVVLIYTFEKEGVLEDVNNPSSLIKVLNLSLYKKYKSLNIINLGMIPKLDNCFTALQNGVKKVIIGKAEKLDLLIEETTGTVII